MKKLLFVILIISLTSNTLAALTFSAQGASGGSVYIIEGSTLTIDIVSDSTLPYTAYFDCDGAVITEPIAAPAAGSGAFVIPDPDPQYCGYFLTADDPSPLAVGTHFTFLLLTYAGDAGQSYTLTLYDETITTVLDTLTVIVEASQTYCIMETSPMYAEWAGVGKPWVYPNCWCYPYQCRGDADGVKIGLFRINSTDLGLFADAYNKGDAKLDQTTICADFDHKKVGLFRINSADLALFAANYNKGDLKVAPCPLDWDGDGDDDYNFWITP